MTPEDLIPVALLDAVEQAVNQPAREKGAILGLPPQLVPREQIAQTLQAMGDIIEVHLKTHPKLTIWPTVGTFTAEGDDLAFSPDPELRENVLAKLASRMLHRILSLDGTGFERYVTQLLNADPDWRDVMHTGQPGDGGVDIRGTWQGQPCVVQCKRYQAAVGPDVILALSQVMQQQDVPLGLVVTTSTFSSTVQKLAASRTITLWDGQEVVQRALQTGLAPEQAAQPQPVSPTPPVPPRPALLLTDEEYAVREQDASFQQHRAWERDPVLAGKKHAQATILGTIRCEACGFRFEQLYGDAGAGYIEYHYKTPFSEIDPAHEPQAHELALVCSNCHSMLHRMRAVLTVPELRQLVQRVVKGA